MTHQHLKFDFLKAEAESLGFFLCGVTDLKTLEHFPDYQKWILDGYHAGMGYLARPEAIAKRADPKLILPEARSLISLAIPYFPAHLAPISTNPQTSGRVAAYAWGLDYHDVLPPLLHRFVERLAQRLGQKFKFKVHTDSSPILEREFAARAGLGWIGKNACLIHPELGSYFLLAEILTDLELPVNDHIVEELCGICQRCIQACPTGCIRSDRTLDAGRCISYLTIENKGEIPPAIQLLLGNWLFGCDICQMVCPWNQRFATPPILSPLQQNIAHAWVDLEKELAISELEFSSTYEQRPISRTRYSGWLRNCIVVAGNLKSKELIPPLIALLHNNPESLIRTHAAHALAKYENIHAQSALNRALAQESNPQVRTTIQSLIGSESR
jgi:epoxyqueuosine reductase